MAGYADRLFRYRRHQGNGAVRDVPDNVVDGNAPLGKVRAFIGEQGCIIVPGMCAGVIPCYRRAGRQTALTRDKRNMRHDTGPVLRAFH